MFTDDPKVDQRLDFDDFENISKLLYAGKLAPHLKCDLKVSTIKEERKFSTGKKLVEILEVVFYPRGLYSDFNHWLRFMHDGKGQIVYFQIGNTLATYPCLVKR